MSTDICERYAKVAARWALMYPISSWALREGEAAEKLARIWGEQIARHLTEYVRDEEMEQLRAERDALKAAIERVREGLKAALATWEPEHEYHRDRVERKGYSMNETAAEVYGDAIEVVTEAIAALDTSNGSGGSVATGGCTSNPAGTPSAPESPEEGNER